MSDNGDELWAWQEETPDGKWGIIASIIPMLSAAPVPLVMRSERHARTLADLARDHQRVSGHRVRLARFTLEDAWVGWP